MNQGHEISGSLTPRIVCRLRFTLSILMSWKSRTLVVILLAASVGLSAQQSAPKHGVNVSPSVQHAPTTSAMPDDARIKNFDFSELARSVEAMSPSSDRDYFAGVLANRQGHVTESIAILEKVLLQIESSNQTRAAMTLSTLRRRPGPPG